MSILKKRLLIVACVLVCIPLLIGIIQYKKEPPKNISYESKQYKTDDVQFVYDLTYEVNDSTVYDHSLLEEALTIIDQAEQFLLLDMFLYNDDYDRSKGDYPEAAKTITDALIAKKEKSPLVDIIVITDKVNTMYGSAPSTYFKQLEENGIDVIITDMSPMRDSNPIYSSIYRPYLQWIKPSTNGFLPNPFNPDANKASIGSYLDLINFKANHRKIVMNEQQALVTSANLTHDGSSLHSNIGIITKGPILKDLYISEQAVAEMSGFTLPNREFTFNNTTGDLSLQYVTEGKIKKAILREIERAEKNASIHVGVFYISDRQVVKALKEAAKRDVHIQLILDPNKDAFGLEKNGIPNRQIAAELMKQENIEVRWYDTDGEQFHSKFLIVKHPEEIVFIGGSANFTRRNLHDYNLENNFVVIGPPSHNFNVAITDYYNRLWNNIDGHFTEEFSVYEDQSIWRKAIYRIQEFTGLSTF